MIGLPSDTSAYLWHHLSGDSIPSDEFPDRNPDEAAPCCAQISPDMASFMSFWCTEPVGHDGAHRAYGADLLAVWPASPDGSVEQ